MPLSRRSLLIASVATAATPLLARAQPAARAPQELKDYTVLKTPVPVESGAKIEVLEFFQYSCPHCATFEPVPGRVEEEAALRRRLPAHPDRVGQQHDAARAHLLHARGAGQACRKCTRRCSPRSRRTGSRMLNPDAIADFMAANGIDRKQWLDTYNSFSVAARANRAGQIWRAYKVDGTPMMAVDGRFMTAPSMVGTREGTLVVLDYLVQRSRARAHEEVARHVAT